MAGTFLNVITVLLGGTLGLLLGGRVPERMRYTVMAGLGLFTASIGLKLFFESKNSIIVLAGLLIGSLLGEWLHIEDGLRGLGVFLEQHFTRGRHEASPGQNSRFVKGFLAASLLFCIGPMAILGSLQDGLSGDYELLAIKSVLDGFAAMAFASTLGVGVLFSALTVLVYQGSLSLLAGQMQAIMTEAMIAEMSAAGGVLLLGIAISSLLELKPIRVGNFLPALAITPLLVALLAALDIQL